MELKKKTVAGVGANTVRSILEAGIALGAFLLFARWLDPADFGLYAIASAFISLARSAQSLGLSQAIVQMESLKRADRDTAFWTQLMVGTALTFLFIFCSYPIAYFFEREALAPVLGILSLGLLLHGFSDVARATLARHLSFVYLGTVTVFGTAIGAGAGIATAYVGGGVWSLVVYQLGITLTGTLAYWLGAGWLPGFRWSTESFRKQFHFGIYVIGKKFVERAGERTDDLLIGYFMGSTMLGYYVIAYRVLKIAQQLLVDTFIHVVTPAFSRIQTKIKQLKSGFLEGMGITALIALPSFIGLGWLAQDVLRVLFGPGWSPSVPILQILVFAGIADVVLRYHSPVLIALDQTDRDFYITVIHSTLLVILFILAIQYNLVIVAGAYTLASILSIPFAYSSIKDLVTVKPTDYISHLLPAFYSTAGTILGLNIAVFLSISSDVLNVIVSTFLAGTTALFVTYLLDKQSIVKLFRLLASTFNESQTPEKNHG